jgi:hypothetical protein
MPSPATFQDALLDCLTGKWVLRGKIHGQETVHDISAEWVLGHQYLRIQEVSREKGAKGQAEYEAIVFIGWDQPTEQYTCLWLDSTGGGGLVPESFGHARRNGDELPFVFKDNDGSVGIVNTFSYDKGSDAWAWAIDNVQDGKATPFARVKLTRK